MERAQRQGMMVHELAIVHQLMTTRLNRALRPLGLTMTHTSLLMHLAGQPDGGTIGAIADAMEVNQPAVSKTVKALADRGAVSVHLDPADARRRTIRLTPDGGALIGRAMQAMHPEATLSLTDLDDDRLGTLIELLRTVRLRLDGAREPDPA
jgi:DNA-binding MarR family transcriptional regulator